MKQIDHRDIEFIIGFLKENLPVYLETLKEARKREPQGWAYGQEFFFRCHKPEYAEKEEFKKEQERKAILDDLIELGYMNHSSGNLYDGESFKGTCSVYTISPKGRDLLIKLEKMLQD